MTKDFLRLFFFFKTEQPKEVFLLFIQNVLFIFGYSMCISWILISFFLILYTHILLLLWQCCSELGQRNDKQLPWFPVALRFSTIYFSNINASG